MADAIAAGSPTRIEVSLPFLFTSWQVFFLKTPTKILHYQFALIFASNPYLLRNENLSIKLKYFSFFTLLLHIHPFLKLQGNFSKLIHQFLNFREKMSVDPIVYLHIKLPFFLIGVNLILKS